MDREIYIKNISCAIFFTGTRNTKYILGIMNLPSIFLGCYKMTPFSALIQNPKTNNAPFPYNYL